MVYLKQTWRNLPERTTPLSAGRLNHLETQFEESQSYTDQEINIVNNFIGQEVERVLSESLEFTDNLGTVNVRDFGATGDGNSDDTQSFQEAINHLEDKGGGTLLVPSGNYYIHSFVELTDNLIIRGSGGTILKKPGAETGVVFAALSKRGKGYGSGASNVTLYGVRFRGKFGSSRQRLANSFHHSEDIRVVNCVFTECSAGAHIFDLQGCRGVLFFGNRFEGFDDDIEENEYINEDIQLDHSTYIGGSVKETDTSVFDGLPTVDVTIHNNVWKTLNIGGRTYPSGIPVGSHAYVEGMNISNIKFTANEVGPGASDTSNSSRGRLHFVGGKNIWIFGNRFEGGDATMTVLGFHQATRGFPLSSVGSSSPSTITLPVPVGCDHISIEGNSFSGFKGGVSTIDALIRSFAEQSSQTYDTNLRISRNVFYDNSSGSSPVNEGQEMIRVYRAKLLTIEANVFYHQRKAMAVLASTDVSIRGNLIVDSHNNTIQTENNERIKIEDNSLGGLTGTPCIKVSGSKGGLISGNSVTSKSSGAVVITVAGPNSSVIKNNIIRGDGVTLSKAIDVTGSGSKAAVVDNLYSSVSTGVSVASGATASPNARNESFS